MPNLFRLSIVSLSGLLSLTMSATSVAAMLVPLPSVVDYTQGNGWGSGVGIQIEFSAAFLGSDQNMVELKPEGAVQWRRGNHLLFWEGYDLNKTELGWRGLFRDRWLVESGARHEIVIPTSRSEKAGLDNLPHRGSHILGFFESKFSLEQDWQSWVSGRLMFGSNEYGRLSKISAGRRFSRDYRNNGTEIVVFTTFSNSDNKNNYFGLNDADEAATGLPAIEFDGGYRSSGVNFIYRIFVDRKIQLTVRAGIEQYANDIEKSRLVSNATEVNAEVSLVWQ